MKLSLISLLFLFLLVLPVNAIYAGNAETILKFDKCTNLTIITQGTLPIIQGEYHFLNCSLIGDNIWNCNCSDDFPLILVTKQNTINSYSIDAQYEYKGRSKAKHYRIRYTPIQKCKQPNDCLNLNVTGCSYDGCNYCCYNECTANTCDNESTTTNNESTITPATLPTKLINHLYLSVKTKMMAKSEINTENTFVVRLLFLISIILLGFLIWLARKKDRQDESENR